MSETAHPPGNVFQNLCVLHPEMKRERILFSAEKPLHLGFFELEFDWLKMALDSARSLNRRKSFREFENPETTELYFVMRSRLLTELISNGTIGLLLVNGCPVLQLDIRGKVGLAEFFEIPPMNRQEFELWEALESASISVEMEKPESPHELMIVQVKKEEEGPDALEMRRTVNLQTGETCMQVFCRENTLPFDPDLENLMDWIEVRKESR